MLGSGNSPRWTPSGRLRLLRFGRIAIRSAATPDPREQIGAGSPPQHLLRRASRHAGSCLLSPISGYFVAAAVFPARRPKVIAQLTAVPEPW